jgi:uncharacterized protein (DUF2267 family)
MSQIAADLEVFDRTLHKTNVWLKHLMQLLPTASRHEAYRAFRATLHALRDRLTVEEVAQLGAQLPMLIRGFYYEGWDPSGKPVKVRHREEFLARIAQELRDGERIDPERVASAVFTLLAARVADGEIEDVKHVLPADIRDLWL